MTKRHRWVAGTFEAELYGDIEAKPEYVQDLGESLGQSVRFKGRAPAKEIPRILSRLDVLAVPWIWWETHPSLSMKRLLPEFQSFVRTLAACVSSSSMANRAFISKLGRQQTWPLV